MHDDWPYNGEDSFTEPIPFPTWECPEGICDCGEGATEELVKLSIMLCTHHGERMAHAKYLVLVNGKRVNENISADSAGWATVEIRGRRCETLVLKWAPADAPPHEGYPYRKHYYCRVDGAEQAESARRRLHNLGFSSERTLSGNVKAFQRHYGYAELSGQLEDIEAQLLQYHDEAVVPNTRPEQSQPAGSAASTPGPCVPGDRLGMQEPDLSHGQEESGPEGTPSLGRPGPNGPSAEPQDPPTAAPQGTPGTAQVVATIPTAEQVYSRNQFVYNDFLPIQSSCTTALGEILTARFWISTDSFKWIVHDKRSEPQWVVWDQYEHIDPLTGMRRVCRLPCSALQAQYVAGNDLRWQNLPYCKAAPDENDIGLECLLLTQKLYDLRYQQASCKIEPCTWWSTPDFIKSGKAFWQVPEYVSSGRLNQCVNQQVERWTHSTPYTIPFVVADPGKTWIIHPHMYVMQAENGAPAAINYGWHKANGALIQGPGHFHPTNYRDYSQHVLLVAGWCEVTFPGTTAPVWVKTETVYTRRHLCGLVTYDGRPLPRTRYDS